MIRTMLFAFWLTGTCWAQTGQVFFSGSLDFDYSQWFGPFNGSFQVEGAIDTSSWIPELDQGLGGAIFATDTTAAQQLLVLGAKQEVEDDTTYNVFGLLFRSPDPIHEGTVPNVSTNVTLFLLWHLDSLALPDFGDSLDLASLLGALSAEHKFVGAATSMNITNLTTTELEFTFNGVIVDMESTTTIVTVSDGEAQLWGFDVEVADPAPLRPESFLQVAPNPFNPSARIIFNLSRPGATTLRVHDLTGRQVADLPLGWLPAGQHEEWWHAGTKQGCATGVYTISLWHEGELLGQQRALLLK